MLIPRTRLFPDRLDLRAGLRGRQSIRPDRRSAIRTYSTQHKLNHMHSIFIYISRIAVGQRGRLLPVPLQDVQRHRRPGGWRRRRRRPGLRPVVRPGRRGCAFHVCGRSQRLRGDRHARAAAARHSRVHPEGGRVGQGAPLQGRLYQARGSGVEGGRLNSGNFFIRSNLMQPKY